MKLLAINIDGLPVGHIFECDEGRAKELILLGRAERAQKGAKPESITTRRDWKRQREADYAALNQEINFFDAYIEERSGRPEQMLLYIARVAEIKKRFPKE